MENEHTFIGTKLYVGTSLSAFVVNVLPGLNETLSVITKIIPIISFVLFVIMNNKKIKEGWNNLFKKNG